MMKLLFISLGVHSMWPIQNQVGAQRGVLIMPRVTIIKARVKIL